MITTGINKQTQKLKKTTTETDYAASKHVYL